MNLSEILAGWYLQNKRNLPWRNSHSPYKIWLSEIILQQTRVDQGLSYYRKLIENYPDIKLLANAPIDEILKHWQGLGYYSRARNLHETAKIIDNEYNGRFPERYDDLLKLKGIGPYTAAAVASIAFNEPVAVVDGNVFRFLARYFGIFQPINTPEGKAHIKKIAFSVLDYNNPGRHNQSIMEFGALQCIPLKPDCLQCPMKNSCYAYKNHSVKELPVKVSKIRTRERYFNYLVVTWGKKIFLKQRMEDDIWKMLYEFPLIETKEPVEDIYILHSDEWQELFAESGGIKILNVSKAYRHYLTHQKIVTRFFRLKIDNPSVSLTRKYVQTDIDRIPKYAVSRLIEKYLSDSNLIK